MQPTDRELAELDTFDVVEHEIAEAIGSALFDLYDAGMFRVHRDWSLHEEREELKKLATRAAVEAILRSPWLTIHELALSTRGITQARAEAA